MRLFIKIASITAIFISYNLHCAFANEIQRYLLKNGLIVVMEESHKSPLVAIEAQIKTGSATEYGYLGSGISHFVEHMLFKGAARWTEPGDIEKAVKSLGGYINAFTSYDITGVHIVVPAAHVNEALEILKDILTSSRFDPAELEKEREVIIKEIRLHNDEPPWYLAQLLWSNMFKKHNYRFPIIGYEPIFTKLTRDDLVAYYKTNFIPDNIVLGVVGDINTGDALKKIKAEFENIERVSPRQDYSQIEPPQLTGLKIREEREVALTYLVMGFHSADSRDKDMFALDILSIILGDGEDSRLFKSLYRQKRIVYSTACSNLTLKDAGIFGINAVLKGEYLDSVLGEIWDQINSLKTNLVSEKELKKAKNIVLSNYIFSRQTVQGEASDLVSNELIMGDFDFSRKYVEGINAVTKEALRDAAKKYLIKENSTIVTLAPKKPAKTEKGAGKGRALALPEVERFTLNNDLKVVLLEDHSLPLFSITAVGLGGIRAENFDDNGVSNLVSQTLATGTKTKNEEQIASGIEGLGASLGSSSGSNTFSVSASGLSKDIYTVLEIFSDVLQNPKFESEKIEREKSAVKGGIKAIDDNIYRSGMRTLKYTFFREHPYRYQLLGRPASVGGLSQKELSAYHMTYYVPNNMVLAVSGDIDKKAVRERITGLFEKFGNRAAPIIKPPQEKKRARPRVLRRNAEKEQSLILLGWPGTTIYDHDKYVLQVLDSILSGVSGRISKTIREDMGLAYTLNAQSLPGIDPGMFLFYIGTTKENLETAKSELFKEIEGLKREGISDDELESAKRQLIGFHAMGLQRIQDIAAQIAIDELCGLGYGNYLMYEDRITHITKECVLRAAKKYLRKDAYVLLIIKGLK